MSILVHYVSQIKDSLNIVKHVTWIPIIEDSMDGPGIPIHCVTTEKYESEYFDTNVEL